MFRIGNYNNLIVRKCFHTKALNTTKMLTQRIEDKIKGTFVENWVKFWVNVGRDYRDVAIDIRQFVKDKPLKTVIILSNFGLVTLLFKTNPDEKSYRSKLISSANDISLVYPNMRREECVKYVRYLENCYNKELIRRTSFGLFSIIWEDNASEHCNNYESNCGYLRLKYSEWFSKIVDVGFLNIWWVISRRMLDYDINY